ncbi:MAG: integrase arm-type DNA-binding domain-containing protein [Comamonadaceae bacterium]|nr:integrase arm-type DNA-binding domain-containing protein [Comamonadaceae bacterium]
MPRLASGPKSDRGVRAIRRPGYHAIGDGLYLQVSASGARSWIFRYSHGGRRREMGLGGYPTVSLAQARARAQDLCRLVRAGGDPLAQRPAATLTFRQCAEAYIEARRAGWRNAKHAAQWQATLAAYAYPILGEVPVAAIAVGEVCRVLEPIWRSRTETANRVRGRIEAVLDWATARGHRAGDNPARWRGHLDKILPARAKVQRTRHHAAMPYAEVPAFIAALADQEGIAALALRFVILTAARTGEAIGARWDEIDGDVWAIPGERMKSGRPHRVPLAPAAVAIVKALRGLDPVFVFPGGRQGKPLSNMALASVLKRMGRTDATVHGFRSAFRDWAAEQTAFPREVAEGALAHVLTDKVEAAYRRSDLFERRRRLMEVWAGFCMAEDGKTPPPA